MDTNLWTHRVSNRKRCAILAASAVAMLALICEAIGLHGWRNGPLLTVSPEEIRLRSEQVRELQGRREKPEGTFELRNTGDEDLQIRLNYGECACRVRGFGKKRVLKPGERAFLTIESDIPPAGVNAAIVEINSNSRTNSTIQLRLVVESDREPPYVQRTFPSRVLIRSVDGSGVAVPLYCDSIENSDAPWIRAARCTLQALEVETPTVETVRVQDGLWIRKYRFMLSLPAQSPEGRGEIQLLSQDSGPPIASVAVQVEPSSPIRAIPAPLLFVLGTDGTLVSKTVSVIPSGMDGEKFEIDLEQSQVPAWVRAVRKETAGGDTSLEITIIDPPSKTTMGQIVLATNHPKCSVFSLPIHVVVSTSTNVPRPD